MTQNVWRRIELFHGFTCAGSTFKEILVRELNGYDEQFLAETSSKNNPYLVTQLLERLVSFEENFKNSNKRDIVRNLSIGDRTLLLITIQKLSFGDSVSCTINCPKCQKHSMMDISIESMVEEARAKKSNDNYLTVSNHKSKIRPLTGVDQELILNSVGDGLLQEKLAQASLGYNATKKISTFSKEMTELISTKLSELDPLADITLNLACPECGFEFQADFLPENFLLDKIQRDKKTLEREIHWLALNYHWHEREILMLPMSKRKRYVNLINKTFAGEVF